MAEAKRVTLVHRRTGSRVVVDEERVASLKTLGLEPEESKPAAKKAAAKSDK